MRVVIIAASAFLTACSSEPTTSNATETTSNATETPKAAEHNWVEKEGDNYLYESGLSQDDVDKGKAVGDIVTFRYLGQKEGQHRLELLDDDGKKLVTASCANPCKIIKQVDSDDGSMERTPFAEASILGSAFTDAFNGHLDVAKAAPAKP